jgi:hypothetical protein
MPLAASELGRGTPSQPGRGNPPIFPDPPLGEPKGAIRPRGNSKVHCWRSGELVIAPAIVIRPILFADSSVNRRIIRTHSNNERTAVRVGVVLGECARSRNASYLLLAASVNQERRRALVMPMGKLPEVGGLNSVTTPPVVIRPILSVALKALESLSEPNGPDQSRC